MGGNAFLTFIESGAPWWVVIIGGTISGILLLVRSSLPVLEKLGSKLMEHDLRRRLIDKLPPEKLTPDQVTAVLGSSDTSEEQSKYVVRPLELKNKPQPKRRRRGRGRGRGKRGRPK